MYGLVTIAGMRKNPQLYDEFLGDVVEMYVDILKVQAKGEEDPEIVEKIEKEISTPIGDLRDYFSTIIDGLIYPVKDDRGLLWDEDMAHVEADLFMEKVRG